MTLLMIGFSNNTRISLEGLNVISHSPVSSESKFTPNEYVLNCKKMIGITDIILVNLLKPVLEFDESFLLSLAYTNSVLIIGVGTTNKNFTLNGIVTRTFESLNDAVEHIKQSYQGVK